MENETPNFGLPIRKGIYDEFIGKYVLIYPSYGNSFGGKLVKIVNGIGTLNPHQGAVCDKEKGMQRKIIYENSKVNMTHINCIEPITKESLENYCEFCNNQDKK
ncbi:MAG: hypothetical protein M1416_00220 [Candidatus Pacearchaeota archaeon]|nr:hypothetical protein [Candidatus Pacearchaeota archaeon]